MENFTQYLASTPANDRIVQGALAEIDMAELATAIAGVSPAVQSIFRRNMSRRAAAFLDEEIEERRAAPAADVQAARGFLAELLERSARAVGSAEGAAAAAAPLPRVSAVSARDILDTFRELAAYARRNGVLALEKLEASIADPLFRRGIEFVVDGTDPLLTRSVLEKLRETVLQEHRTRLNMIIDGIDSLAAREHPAFVERKLGAYVIDAQPADDA